MNKIEISSLEFDRKFEDYNVEAIAETIIDYVNDIDVEIELIEKIYDAINNVLIYYSDQWNILEHYCSPQDANFDYALECFVQDIYELITEV